jgi:hypothetical protein
VHGELARLAGVVPLSSAMVEASVILRTCALCADLAILRSFAFIAASRGSLPETRKGIAYFNMLAGGGALQRPVAQRLPVSRARRASSSNTLPGNRTSTYVTWPLILLNQ